MKRYNHKAIESKWKKRWEKEGIYKTEDPSTGSGQGKKKCYVLDMFPYPSGEGLHVGHPKGYIATDIYSRYKRMNGFNILHPMGWDAFGLPAENYALEHKIHPRVAVEKNIKRFKEQLSKIGFNYDWDREINTTDPEYYKWTQWIFLQLFKKGLAYQSDEPINWCPSCKTGLAKEDLEEGKCERCGSVVEQKPMRQWVLKIREYADRLLEDLDELEWPESIKELQRNWIGRSEGVEISFEIKTSANFVLLHGFTGSPDANFFPWLKQELERRGHKVQAPQLPNTDNPTVPEQVEYVLKNISFDENTILLGHSLGAPVALKAVEALSKPIQKLILAAGFIEPHFEDHDRPFADTFDWKFNAERIRANTKEIVFLRASNDSAVPHEAAENMRHVFGGVIIDFKAQDDHVTGNLEPEVLKASLMAIDTFTTRPDTLFGATYMVLAPEHPLVQSLESRIENLEEVKEYIEKAKKRTEIERVAGGKEKTGVELKGIKAINPANNKEIPIWIADYVLVQYGTGAIMAVPAHDDRDLQFAKKFGLPIKPVIARVNSVTEIRTPGLADALIRSCIETGFTIAGDGLLINSDEFDGMKSEEAKEVITKFVGGEKRVTYKLRDWVFSRQRYWGEPIPIIHCEKCGAVPVPEEELPVLLPEVKLYEPTGTGESPLANIKEWVNTTCPKCNGSAERETNTMPQWAGSSWYYLRYIDPKNKNTLVSKKKEKYWSPVDVYVGGTEHATRHLIYARFWHKFLYDIGVVSYKEPFRRLKNQGLIYGEDGRKMSKRYGNVINPDELIERFGADTLRLYEMFMGPFEDGVLWSTDSMVGARRFLEKVWRLGEKVGSENTPDENIERLLHQTIKKVSDDIECFKFNTAVSALMIFANALDKEKTIGQDVYKAFLRLLAPFAPYIAEELWFLLGNKESIHLEAWPSYDEEKTKEQMIVVVVQVNGKVRDTIEALPDQSEGDIREKALQQEKIRKWIGGKEIKKIVIVKNKLVNIVVG